MGKNTAVSLRHPEGKHLLSAMMREGAQHLIVEALRPERQPSYSRSFVGSGTQRGQVHGGEPASGFRRSLPSGTRSAPAGLDRSDFASNRRIVEGENSVCVLAGANMDLSGYLATFSPRPEQLSAVPHA